MDRIAPGDDARKAREDAFSLSLSESEREIESLGGEAQQSATLEFRNGRVCCRILFAGGAGKRGRDTAGTRRLDRVRLHAERHADRPGLPDTIERTRTVPEASWVEHRRPVGSAVQTWLHPDRCPM